MTKQKEAEERKKEIIDTARRLFGEKGYKNTQVKDIVSEVGVAQGLFYYYFKSKDEVLEAVAEQYADNIICGVTELIDVDMKSFEKIVLIIELFLKRAEEEKQVFEAMQQKDQRDMHSKILNHVGERLVPVILKIVEQGNKYGELNCKYPLQSTKIMIYGIIDFMNEVSAEKKIKYLKENLDVFKEMASRVYGFNV